MTNFEYLKTLDEKHLIDVMIHFIFSGGFDRDKIAELLNSKQKYYTNIFVVIFNAHTTFNGFKLGTSTGVQTKFEHKLALHEYDDLCYFMNDVCVDGVYGVMTYTSPFGVVTEHVFCNGECLEQIVGSAKNEMVV